MTREQIERKAKEIANQWLEPSDYNIARDSASEMAEWLLSHQWVSVQDELPPPISIFDPISDRVLVHTSLDCVFVAHYDHYYDEWLTAKMDNNEVTHWMPIPPLTEKGGEDE